MRILILSDRIPPENKGGAGIIAWNLAKGLQRTGHDVHVIAATHGEAFEEAREGILTHHLRSRYPERFHAFLSLYNPQTVGHLRQLYRRIRPDVLNAHNIHHDLSYYSLTMAHRMGIGTVFSSHDVMPFAYAKLSHFIDPTKDGVDAPEAYRLPSGYNRRQMRFRYNPLRNRIIRHVLTHHTDQRTTPSEELKRAHEANDLPPFTTVHNGIDAEAFIPPQAVVDALRERLNLHGHKVILFAGRLTGAKGVNEMLRALAALVKRVPAALLLVLSSRSIEGQVGQPEFQHLRERHIRPAGWLSGDELAAAYQLAHVAVVPSVTFETLGMVNLEAMAAGIPALATCYGGSREAVIDGQTGYIINPFKTDQFVAKLEKLLTDDVLRQRMGQTGREHVIANFSIERQVREMEALYRRARRDKAPEKQSE